jgi:hypothetical protein
MALKIFKGIWFFSVVGLLLTFFYVYAGLPEWVTLSEEGAVPSIPKNSLFYFSLSLMAVINTLVFVVTRLPIKQKPDFKAWFYGLTITINLFFIASLGFLHVYNSGERYDYTSMAPAIYGSLFLVSAWIISWPIYVLSQKILAK